MLTLLRVHFHFRPVHRPPGRILKRGTFIPRVVAEEPALLNLISGPKR
jgi:hypothetical protein